MSGFLPICLLLLISCAHSIPVPLQEVPGLARFHETGEVEVHDGVERVRVTHDDAPQLTLRLRRSCSFWQYLSNRCDKVVSSPLAAVRSEGDGLTMPVKTSVFFGHTRLVKVSMREIESARISLDGYVPSGWSPSWGVGFAIVGPVGIGGVMVQYLPDRWLAIEAGTLPAADLLVAYGGVRLRPVEIGPVRPFVGGWANYAGLVDPNTGDASSMAAVGPRAGLDVSVASGRCLITLEFDVAHPLNDDHTFYGGLEGSWIPWGGGAVSYMF